MYHIIVNPAAGLGRSLLIKPKLEALFKTGGLPFTTTATKGPTDARRLAREACEAGSDGIIAIGGDGTVQEIVSGMYDASADAPAIPTPLGILPYGSGNDFALQMMQKNKKTDAQAEAERVFNHVLNRRTRTVDLIRANDMAYLNIANIGLDARIVLNAESLKKRLKKNAYLASSFKSIVQHQNVSMRVVIDGQVMEGSYTLIAVCNGQYYGGGLRIAPQAKVDDGLITVCLVDGMPRLYTLVLFPSILFERHVKLKPVRYFTGREVSIALKTPEPLCLDGNLYPDTVFAAFSIVPGALRLFADQP